MTQTHRPFPHRVLLQPPRIQYSGFGSEQVRQSPFADFRLETGDQATRDKRLDLDSPGPEFTEGGRFRFIFHTAFCGSTLVAGLLDLPKRLISIREPQGIRDLSEIKAYYLDWMSLSQLQRMLTSYLSALADWAADDDHILIKPSNLSNGLAHDLLQEADGSKSVLLSCPLRDFLLSCLSKDRQMLRLISHEVGHWHRNFPHRSRYGIDGSMLARDSLYGPAIVWHLQRLHLKQLRSDLPERCSELMDFSTFYNDPAAFMNRVAGFLDVPLDAEAVLDRTGTHAKTGQPFSQDSQRKNREALAAANAGVLGAAESAMAPLLDAFPI